MHVFIGGILKNDVVMLNFLPELKDTEYQHQNEFVFLVDRSGERQSLCAPVCLLIRTCTCIFVSNNDVLIVKLTQTQYVGIYKMMYKI